MSICKVEFSGGFHNSPAKIIHVKINKKGLGSLSTAQIRGLDNHFCGLDGCACGGAYRARVELLTAGYKSMSKYDDITFLIKE